MNNLLKALKELNEVNSTDVLSGETISYFIDPREVSFDPIIKKTVFDVLESEIGKNVRRAYVVQPEVTLILSDDSEIKVYRGPKENGRFSVNVYMKRYWGKKLSESLAFTILKKLSQRYNISIWRYAVDGTAGAINVADFRWDDFWDHMNRENELDASISYTARVRGQIPLRQEYGD